MFYLFAQDLLKFAFRAENCSGDSGVQKWGFFLVFLSIR